MPEEKEKEKKDEGKIILETRMHCEDCRYKVYKAIIGYPGVEDVSINFKENKVTLKAPKVDAKKLYESVKKKSGGKIINLLHPDPNKKKEEPKKEEKKPVEVTVVLKAGMDCSSCTRKIEKAAWKIKGVQNINVKGEILTIKGLDLDPKKVCEAIMKKSGKHAEVVPPKKKDGEQKDDNSKKDGEKKDDNVKKDEKQAPQIITQYVYAPQYFSDENPNACVLM